MSLKKIVSKEQFERLNAHFGQQKIERVDYIVSAYASKWGLTDISLIPYYSVNILFRVQAEHYGQAVLKIHGVVDRYTEREIQMLLQKQPLYCDMYQYNKADGVMLLKAYEGHSLHKIESLEARLQLLCELVTKLYLTHASLAAKAVYDTIYPTYRELLERIKQWSKQTANEQLLAFIEAGIAYYEDIKEIYTELYILHGDLHHDNVIYKDEQTYTLIDPKGVIDHYIFELPRFILNELDAEVRKTNQEKIFNIINYLSHKLNIEKVLLAKAFYIEATLSFVWSIQDCTSKELEEIYIQDLQFCHSCITPFLID